MRNIILIFIVFLLACQEPITVPKPRMYPRITFPEGEMATFDEDYCKMTFEIPSYIEIERDSFFFEEAPQDPCWFDLNIPSLNAKIHCSYRAITTENSFDNLLVDAFKLVGKHNIKANYRKESLIENPSEQVFGMLFNIEGPVATPIQFYVTDSVSNFFRASVYYDDKVDADSTQIITDFLAKDINHIIESFKWNKTK